MANFSSLILFCCAVVAYLCTQTDASPVKRNVPIPEPKVIMMPQRIDHFAATMSDRTYDQRIFYSLDFVNATNPNTPVILYTGGESEIEWYWDNAGTVFDIAAHLRAAVVFVEHRYYGQSLPFGADSYTRENMRYLSSEQALADIARALMQFKSGVLAMPAARVLALGGSYAGMLAGWARYKYPHLVTAAVASSAPYRIIGMGEAGSQGSQYSYFKTVTDDYEAANSLCPKYVRQAYAALDEMYHGGEGAEIASTLNLCAPVGSAAELDHLKLWVRQALLAMAQGDYPYGSGTNPTALRGLPAWPVQAACDAMVNASGSALEKLAAATTMYYGAFGSTHSMRHSSMDRLAAALGMKARAAATCFDPADGYTECADRTGCGTDLDGRAWDWQVCAELSILQSTTGVSDMFPAENWDGARLTDYCEAAWGVKPELDYLAMQFPGSDWTSASDILFTNGLLDPWGYGGIMASQANNLIAMNIPDAAHHLDLNRYTPGEPAAVTRARDLLAEIIEAFLSEPGTTRDGWLARLRADADNAFPAPLK